MPSVPPNRMMVGRTTMIAAEAVEKKTRTRTASARTSPRSRKKNAKRDRGNQRVTEPGQRDRQPTRLAGGDHTHTTTDREALFAELEEVSESESTFNKQESTVGLRAIGAAVNGPDGYPVGALSISGPAHRFKGDTFRKEIPDLILASANKPRTETRIEGIALISAKTLPL